MQIRSWNIRHFLRLGLKSSIFQNITKLYFQKYKKFFQGFCFLKYKKFFLGWILFKFFWPWAGKYSAWRKYKKDFFWENIRFFLILELESCISRNIMDFFGAWAGKCARWLSKPFTQVSACWSVLSSLML